MEWNEFSGPDGQPFADACYSTSALGAWVMFALSVLYYGIVVLDSFPFLVSLYHLHYRTMSNLEKKHFSSPDGLRACSFTLLCFFHVAAC